MRTAVADGLILTSPCKVDGAGSERAAERPIATVAEVEALALAMPDRLRLAVLLGTWCQLRRGEFLGLRRRDIDLMHGTVHVEQSRSYTRDGTSFVKAPKSAAGRRTLAIPGNVTELMTRHLDQFVGCEPHDLVFTMDSGAPLTPATLQRAWVRARRALGRSDLHFHDLRHTGLTMAAATGATTAELMHRAGHASANASLRYQHATQDRDRILADALATLVSPAAVVAIGRESRASGGGPV
jgi:integrase